MGCMYGWVVRQTGRRPACALSTADALGRASARAAGACSTTASLPAVQPPKPLFLPSSCSGRTRRWCTSCWACSTTGSTCGTSPGSSRRLPRPCFLPRATLSLRPTCMPTLGTWAWQSRRWSTTSAGGWVLEREEREGQHVCGPCGVGWHSSVAGRPSDTHTPALAHAPPLTSLHYLNPALDLCLPPLTRPHPHPITTHTRLAAACTSAACAGRLGPGATLQPSRTWLLSWRGCRSTACGRAPPPSTWR